ncbi:MAG TPA: FAD-dependent oxidoreductase [Gammaproteobacteria bacterium]|nr:FAD-dependent oxidoreductase [Gammaproteobacteria bacterium]
MDPIVIIGTGLAGYSLAKELRKLDAERPLVLLSADDGRFYSKPLLSNALAKGKEPDELATASAGEMAQQLNAEVRSHCPVQALHPARREVELAGGERLTYDRLVLALGADPIRIPFAGDAADEVLSVNDLADYTRFRSRLEGVQKVMILGAGLIGCEFANDLCQAGYQVAVADLADQPLGRLLPPESGAALRAGLTAAGVEWHLGTGAERIDRADNGYRVTLGNGAQVEANLVLSAIGLRPRTVLAREAGLKVERGIVTDRLLRSSDPHIYALGDCLEVEGLVLPYVMPIMNGARALARTLTGTPTELVYPAMPVAVKTPAHPVVVSPPPMGSEGKWRTEAGAEGTAGFFESPDGELLGFALTGSRVGEKQTLTKRLPAMLAAAGQADAA